MKKKKLFIIIGITVFIITSLICLYLFLNSSKLKDIKSHYNSDVIVSKNTNLYDKNKKKIGSINKDFTLELDKFKSNDTYFKIKNTNFYVYYKDVKKTKEVIKDELNNNYLEFNNNIKTKKKTVFYNDNKKILTINTGVELKLLYMDENYYYVKYLNRIMGIKKSSSEIVNIEGSNETDATNISIVHYTKIDDCDTCISTDTVKEELNYLKENGYYTITIDEYTKWKNSFVRLKEKAILLTTNEINDNVNALKDEFNVKIELIDDNTPLKFNDDNKTTTKESDINSLSRYVVIKKTTIDKFKQITLGEDVVYEEPKPVINNQASYGGQGIAVVNYHFFYDPSLGEGCNENICLDVKDFREQLSYLRDNGFKTLTMDEFRKWMYGEIELPEKSVLLTIDDGAFGTGRHNGNKLIPILEEYNMHATLFLITGWWDVNNYRSKNLDIQSHTNDMHDYGSCGKGHVVCASHDELLADLQKSLQIVDNNNSFCFPFYSYSDESVETVKEAGFKMAFIGGNRKATRSNNKYLIPRFPIYKTTSLQQFINMVN